MRSSGKRTTGGRKQCHCCCCCQRAAIPAATATTTACALMGAGRQFRRVGRERPAAGGWAVGAIGGNGVERRSMMVADTKGCLVIGRYWSTGCRGCSRGCRPCVRVAACTLRSPVSACPLVSILMNHCGKHKRIEKGKTKIRWLVQMVFQASLAGK